MRKTLLVFLASSALWVPTALHAKIDSDPVLGTDAATAPVQLDTKSDADQTEATPAPAHPPRAVRPKITQKTVTAAPAPAPTPAPAPAAAPAAPQTPPLHTTAPATQAPVPIAKPAVPAQQVGLFAKTSFANVGAAQRVAISFSPGVKIRRVAEKGNLTVIFFWRNVKYEAPEVPKNFAKSFVSIKTGMTPSNARAITVQHVAGVPAKVSYGTNEVYIDVAAAKTAEKAPEKPAEKPAEKAPIKVETKPTAAAPTPAQAQALHTDDKAKPGPAKVEYSKENDVEKLKFTFSRPVAAAVFERFGYYWLVFDTDDTADLPESAKKSPIFGGAKKVTANTIEIATPQGFGPPVKTPLIFNLTLNKAASAIAVKNGNEWEIDFDPNIKFVPEKPLSLNEIADTYQIPATGVNDKIVIKDELTNDYLQVFPLTELGSIKDQIKKSNFELPKTVQGVVIKPTGDLLTRYDEQNKIKIVRPANAPVAAIKQAPKASLPIYEFKKWPQLNAEDFSKADQKARKGDRLNYGKFLFSQGLYSEAAVNLQGIQGFDASFLTGASDFMAGHYADANKVFDGLTLPQGVDENELLMWRAPNNYDLAQVNPSAAKPVDISKFMLPRNTDNYPDNIKNRLLFPLTQQMIEGGKLDDAQAYITLLAKSATDPVAASYLKFLQGKIYDHQGKQARAHELWLQVIKENTDRESRAKASYEIAMQDYSLGKIKIDDAIKRLNDIRIIWRGDMFEYTLLNKLADLYVQNNQEYESLRVYKEMLSTFPDYPNNLQIATKMRDIYEKALDKAFADKEDSFKAVSIYYEFEELKPVGQKGDQITLQLADNLAKYDLLDDSAKVLQKYSASLTDPGQKAEIGTRIAILDFLNNKSKDALQALKDSDAPNLPGYLIQERKILEIRCLIELGELDKAISMLSSVPDEQANRFRADIYWKQKKWQQMVDIYGLIAQRNDEDIMRIAIAEVLLEDKKSLAALKVRYDDQMKKGRYAQNFEFVTDPDNVDYRNLSDSLKLDETEDVINKYRTRLKDKGLEGVTGKTSMPAGIPEPKPIPSPEQPAITKPSPITPAPATDAAPKN